LLETRKNALLNAPGDHASARVLAGWVLGSVCFIPCACADHHLDFLHTQGSRCCCASPRNARVVRSGADPRRFVRRWTRRPYEI